MSGKNALFRESDYLRKKLSSQDIFHGNIQFTLYHELFYCNLTPVLTLSFQQKQPMTTYQASLHRRTTSFPPPKKPESLNEILKLLKRNIETTCLICFELNYKAKLITDHFPVTPHHEKTYLTRRISINMYLGTLYSQTS